MQRHRTAFGDEWKTTGTVRAGQWCVRAGKFSGFTDGVETIHRAIDAKKPR